MAFWFFISYARADYDSLMEQFFNDLRDEVRIILGVSLEQISFVDTHDVKAGEEWEPVVANALRASRTCVAMCSQSYFNSTYCGKEYSVFLRRQQTLSAACGRQSRVIFPVLWVLPKQALPAAVTQFQYTQADFPAAYVREGLRYLMKLSRFNDEYQQFVSRAARQLVEAGNEIDVSQTSALPSLREVRSAFEPTPATIRTDAPERSDIALTSATSARVEERLRKDQPPELPVKVRTAAKVTSLKERAAKSDDDKLAIRLQVFLCHSSRDKQAVRKLYARLKADGFTPWLDEKNLLPGQDWDSEIRKAVKASHVVVVCLSASSINKEGYVQKEIIHALNAADEKPPGTIFLIPARLERCEVPERLERWHRVDLFDGQGYRLLLEALRARQTQLDDRFSFIGTEPTHRIKGLMGELAPAVRHALEFLAEAPFPILKEDLAAIMQLDDRTGESLRLDPVYRKLVRIETSHPRIETINEMTWFQIAAPQIAEALRGTVQPLSIDFRHRLTRYVSELGIRVLKSMRSLDVRERDGEAYRLAARLATYSSALLASEEISTLWAALWDRIMKDIQGGRSSSLYALLILAGSPAFSTDEPREPIVIGGYSLESAISRLCDILKDRTFVQPELAAVLLGFLSWRDGRATVLDVTLRELDLSATGQATTLARVAAQTSYALRKNRNPLIHVNWSD